MSSLWRLDTLPPLRRLSWWCRSRQTGRLWAGTLLFLSGSVVLVSLLKSCLFPFWKGCRHCLSGWQVMSLPACQAVAGYQPWRHLVPGLHRRHCLQEACRRFLQAYSLLSFRRWALLAAYLLATRRAYQGAEGLLEACNNWPCPPAMPHDLCGLHATRYRP